MNCTLSYPGRSITNSKKSFLTCIFKKPPAAFLTEPFLGTKFSLFGGRIIGETSESTTSNFEGDLVVVTMFSDLLPLGTKVGVVGLADGMVVAGLTDVEKVGVMYGAVVGLMDGVVVGVLLHSTGLFSWHDLSAG